MTIQGYQAVLWMFRDTWIPFMCASDISVNMDVDEIAIRTIGDGQYKKFGYQALGYNITLSGLLKFDADNFTGFDMIDNMRNFTNVQFRVTFDDDEGNEKSIQGNALVKSGAVSISPGDLVKNDFTLLGNGAFLFFNGSVSCDTSIDSISPDETSDGTVTATYTYTGPVYQVKYQIDGTGDFVSSLVDIPLVVSGLANGIHSIHIIPLCQNGNEGIGLTQSFSIASGLTCGLVITGRTQDGNLTLTPVFDNPDSETVATYQYSIDGGAFIVKNLLPTTDPIDISGMALGDHTLAMIPFCSSGVAGTGFTDGDFSIDSSPSTSLVNYSFVNDPFSGNQMWIYVDGILQVNLTAASSGSITVSVGQLVKGVLQSTASGGARGVGLRTTNQTTSSILNDQSGRSPQVFQYTFTADGSTYLIGGVISP